MIYTTFVEFLTRIEKLIDYINVVDKICILLFYIIFTLFLSIKFSNNSIFNSIQLRTKKMFKSIFMLLFLALTLVSLSEQFYYCDNAMPCPEDQHCIPLHWLTEAGLFWSIWRNSFFIIERSLILKFNQILN